MSFVGWLKKLTDIKAKTDLIGASVALETGGILATVNTDTDKKVVGRIQTFQKAVAGWADQAPLTLATVTAQSCKIKSIVVRAVSASQTELTSVAVTGGTAGAVTFISAVDGVKANITAIDQQVCWMGTVGLPMNATIVMTFVGTGHTVALDLLVTFEYEAVADGGILA